jgi:speckle-type POZ protein
MGITLDTATTTMTTTTVSSGGGRFFVKSPASGSHLLQIDGYSIAKNAPNGTSLKSCPFTVGGYSWIIHLFPNGDCPESADFVSVFVGLHEYHKWRRLSLHVEFSFVDEVEKQDPAHVRSRQVQELFFNFGVGYRRFIPREALESTKHLREDRFTVRCDFVITGYVDIPEPYNVHARRSSSDVCGFATNGQ